MVAFKIHHAAAYGYPMHLTYTVSHHVLSLVIGGLDLFRYPGRTLKRPKPLIFLIPKGTEATFAFSGKRLNYGIILTSRDMRPGQNGETLEVRSDGNWHSMPMAAAVSMESLEDWRFKFEQIVDAYRNPSPFRTLRAEANVASAIAWLLGSESAPVAQTPAGRLRALIESDPAERESLEELCARCRYSSDHLRMLFEKEFGISPKVYRERCRMSRAMELLGRGALSIKEIAGALGFSSASHFSSAFRAMTGVSPRAALPTRMSIASAPN